MNRSLNLDEALAILKGGGVIAYPTEAVYGLGCRAADESAVQRVLALKRRSRGKGLIVLADRLERLDGWLETLSPSQRARLDESWPGPVTWLIPATGSCPPWLTGDHTSLAVRISAHPTCSALTAGLSEPLVSTSANTEGRAPARDPAAVEDYFPEGLDGILVDSLGGETSPTLIYDLSSGQRVR